MTDYSSERQSTGMPQPAVADLPLRHILDSLPVAAYICDRNGLITYFNGHARELWQRTPALNDPTECFSGSARLLTADGVPLARDRCCTARALEASREYSGVEEVIARPDGSLATVLVHAKPIYDDAGQLAGAIILLVDITRRTRAEHALSESERRFQSVTTNAPAAIFVKDRDGRYTVANPLACEALGRPEGAVGYTDHDLLPVEIADALRKTDMEVMTSGLPVKREEIVRRPGFDHTYLSVKFPLAGDGRLAEGVCGVSIDITDRKRAEEALLESEERFHTLADNIAQLAWMADDSGAIFWYNKRWFDYTGTTLEQVQGWGWQVVHAPEHVDRVTEKFARCIALGEVWEDTFPLRGADGRFRWFLSRAIPIRDADGQVLRWFGTNTDITAQRDAEEALRAADRRKDEFLATLAHELRNPLAPISNSLHILRMAEDVDPSTERVHGILERQTHHLSRLVDDLLEVSRITQGKIELRRQQVEFAGIMRSAVETSRPFIDARSHQLAINLPPEPVLLDADATRLTQAVANLLTNAAKYTPTGGQIWLTAEADASEAVIRVRDNGIGIDADLLPRVFEKFAQGSSSDARSGGGGLGIGLTLARNMVELHGGSIEASSQGLGRGSQFTIRLPLQGTAPQTPATDRGLRIGKSEADSRRILVVDDARDSAYILSRLLETLGHQVFTADNGATALEIARREHPDVVFSDIAMADMDGYEMARLLRQEPGLENVLLVALTGFGQESDRAHTNEAGFDHHLVKPVSPEQLKQTLSSQGIRRRASSG